MLIIEPYREKNKNSCLSAFKSNVPDFFTIDEIDQFDNWLSYIVSDHKPETCHYSTVRLREDIIGCGGFEYDIPKDRVTLVWGLIHKDYHKKGFGKQLLDYRLNLINNLYPTATIVIDTTQYSFHFFEKYGFKLEKITEDYYSSGLHRYDMLLENK